MSWSVYVHGVGYVGTVTERNEELARCAALSFYGNPGYRRKSKSRVIFEDDDFDVRPA